MSAELKCPIWGSKAEYFLTSTEEYDLDSPRAGGRYRIGQYAAATFESRYGSDKAAKAKLSSWIFDNQNPRDTPRITVDLIEKIVRQRAIRPFEKAERLLRFVARNSSVLNISGLRWDRDHGFGEVDRALAATELLNPGELETVLEYLVRKGFCSTKIDNAAGTGFVWLTLEGAEHVQSVPSARDSDQAFVAMWFSAETQAAYDFGIAPAIRDNAFRPVRIDQKEHSNKIDDEIIAEIRGSRFVVADFTCGTVNNGDASIAIARGGVYFEAGFALGLNIPVVWTVRADLINHVHFDTRQYNHITWTTPEDLRTSLGNRIGAVVGKFREGR